jgi:hypothetical protein
VTPKQQRALYELVALFLKSENPSVSGRALRARLRRVAPSLDEQRALTASLSPDLAVHEGANMPEDWFRPTLPGLLEGDPQSAEIIRATLQFFRHKARREPEFRSFTWTELKRFFESHFSDPYDVEDVQQLQVLHVLEVAGLSSAWYGTHWGAPRDVESLLEVDDVPSLLEYRARAHEPRAQQPAHAPDRPRSAQVETTYDVFISHASEDKAEVARPLYQALTRRNVRVWFDEAELKLGDSLRRNIDNGLARCRYGLVILSPHFFEKEWPQRELDGLVARETASGRKAILPVWHNVDKNVVASYSPTLADRLAAPSTAGIDSLVDAICRALQD